MIFQSFNLVKRDDRHGQRAHGPAPRDTGPWRSLLALVGRRTSSSASRRWSGSTSWTRHGSAPRTCRAGSSSAWASPGRSPSSPRIILADEPVATLDPPTCHQVMRDLQRINRELGITTIVNLHFLDLARIYGDRVIGLRAGELVYDGTGAAADEHVFRDIYGRSLTDDDILGSPARPRPSARDCGRACQPAPGQATALALRLVGTRRLRRLHAHLAPRAVGIGVDIGVPRSRHRPRRADHRGAAATRTSRSSRRPSSRSSRRSRWRSWPPSRLRRRPCRSRSSRLARPRPTVHAAHARAASSTSSGPSRTCCTRSSSWPRSGSVRWPASWRSCCSTSG